MSMCNRICRFVVLLGIFGTGCQVNRSSPDGAKWTFTKACAEGRLDLVKAWRNPPLNEVDEFDTSPLGHAVHRGDRVMVEFLLRKGADPNGGVLTDCIIYRSALTEAYWQDDKPMIVLLKRYGADLNHRDKDGQTDLHRSTLFSCEVVERLLKAGLDVNVVDNEGRTVFFCLPSTNQMDVEELDAFVKLYKKYGADINRPLPNGGATPLEEALEEKDYLKAEVFLKNGAHVRQRALHQKKHRSNHDFQGVTR